MKRKIKIVAVAVLTAAIALASYKGIKKINPNPAFTVGQKLASLNGVYVYYNGGVAHTGSRNLSEDGYNLGLTYQCVEFVKRYYYQHYRHKMPDSYGNAKDFFDATVPDGALNKKRMLLQFTNPGIGKPQIGDLLIFDGHLGNKYGHVAIVSAVFENQIELIQQNPGPFAPSRIKLPFTFANNTYTIDSDRLMGWLRK